jgi:hypothetical protein
MYLVCGKLNFPASMLEGIGLMTYVQLTFIPAIVVTEIELRSLQCELKITLNFTATNLSTPYSIDVPSELPGCRLGSASAIIIVAYIALALSETGEYITV